MPVNMASTLLISKQNRGGDPAFPHANEAFPFNSIFFFFRRFRKEDVDSGTMAVAVLV